MTRWREHVSNILRVQPLLCFTKVTVRRADYLVRNSRNSSLRYECSILTAEARVKIVSAGLLTGLDNQLLFCNRVFEILVTRVDNDKC